MARGTPLLTIITVVKNGGGGFEKTRDSILAQTNHSFEWIIKDGGSTDGTLEKALQLIDDRVTVLDGKDAGIYDAMNQAVKYVSGRYVHFLNAGDYYASNDSVQQLYEAVKMMGYPAMLVCFIMNQSTRTVLSCPAKPNRYYLYRRCFCHQAVFFHKSLIPQNMCYDITLKLKADHDLILKCLNQGKSLSVVSKVMVCYDGSGISDNRKHISLLDTEADEVHRRHFTTVERALFGFVQEATLWRIRRAMLRHNRRSINGIYNRLLLYINRKL